MQSVKIFQIYYKKEQERKIDPRFIPYDNSTYNDPIWCEYGVIKRLYDYGHTQHGITGFVSWKYKDITHQLGQSVLNFIKTTAADCYILYPIEFEGTKNIWRQGEEAHPHMFRLVQQIFKELDYFYDIASLDRPCNEFLLRNYFAGTKQFWDAYMQFTIPVYEYLKNNLTPPQQKLVCTDQSSIGSSPTMHPYIMERLFSTFIALCNLGVLPYTWKCAVIPKVNTIEKDYRAFKEIVLNRF